MDALLWFKKYTENRVFNHEADDTAKVRKQKLSKLVEGECNVDDVAGCEGSKS